MNNEIGPEDQNQTRIIAYAGTPGAELCFGVQWRKRNFGKWSDVFVSQFPTAESADGFRRNHFPGLAHRADIVRIVTLQDKRAVVAQLKEATRLFGPDLARESGITAALEYLAAEPAT